MDRTLAQLLLLLPLLCFSGPPVNAQEISADKVKSLAAALSDIAQRAAEIAPETVQARFGQIAALQSAQGPDEYVWLFVGANTDQGVRWLSVEFQPSEPSARHPWVMLQLQLALPKMVAHGGSVYELARSTFLDRFGQPAYGRHTDPGGRLAWAIGPYHELVLQTGMFAAPIGDHDEDVVAIEIVGLQGESEGG